MADNEQAEHFVEHLPKLAVSANKNMLAMVHSSQLTVVDSLDGRLLFKYDARDQIKVSFSCVVFSATGYKLAVGGSDKVLRVWDTSSWNLVGISINHKRISAAVFSADEKHVLFCDKFGDVCSVALSALYSSDLHPQPSTVGAQAAGAERDAMANRVLALAHVSQLTDMLMSQEGDYILTADRDEKVRVSHFPYCYDVQSYCMAHKELVTSVQSVKLMASGKEYVISGSADGTIRVFDLLTGDNVTTHTFDKVNEEDVVVQCIKAAPQANAASAVVAVLLEKSSSVLVFELREENSTVSLELLQTVSSVSEIYSIAIASTETQHKLFVLSAEQPHITLFVSQQQATSAAAAIQFTAVSHATLNDNVTLNGLQKGELEYYSMMTKQRVRYGGDHVADDEDEEGETTTTTATATATATTSGTGASFANSHSNKKKTKGKFTKKNVSSAHAKQKKEAAAVAAAAATVDQQQPDAKKRKTDE